MLAQALHLAIILFTVVQTHQKASCFTPENTFSSFANPNLLGQCSQKPKDDKPTILTFYATHQTRNDYDSLSIKVIIRQTESSLREAIFKARRKVSQIFEIYQNYCNSLISRDCIYPINLKNYKTNPRYSSISSSPIFNSFTITNQIEILVREASQVGQLVDNILQAGVHQIQNLEWILSSQTDQQKELMNSGMGQAKQLCHHLKRKVGNVLSIKQVLGNRMQNISKQKKQKRSTLLQFRVECVNKSFEEVIPNRSTRKNKNKKK